MTVLSKWMDLLKKFDSEPYGDLKDKRIEAWKEIIQICLKLNLLN